MAEFKIYGGIKDEINSFESPGGSFSGSSAVSTDGVSTLKTSVKYVNQHKKIATLLNLYRQLLEKDASDLRAVVEETEQLDARISHESFN